MCQPMKQVVILAGGMGTRIQSVANGLPKSLIPVAGKPFLAWQLEKLRDCGIDDVVMCIGYLADAIEQFAGDGADWGLRVRYVRDPQAKLLGTGGAIVNAMPLLEPEFGVLYGDSYLPFDFSLAYTRMKSGQADAIMCVHLNRGLWDRSNIRVEDDRVIFYSKSAADGEADHIDYGFSVFRKSIFEEWSNVRPPLDMARIIERLVSQRRLLALNVPERFFEIGKPDGLAELQHVLESQDDNAQ